VSVSDGELSANANMTINVTEAEQTNQPPTYDETEYSFSASEDILDTDIIGSISATDNDGDDLTYEIVQNDNGLFEINTVSGEISLAEGMDLDFETSEQHTITVGVNDGINDIVGMEVAITVTDVAEAHPDDKAAFVTTWETTTAGETIHIGLSLEYAYNFQINWGDGQVSSATAQIGQAAAIFHQYETPGVYKASIIGVFPAIYMGFEGSSSQSLKSIEQWGSIQWQTMHKAFHGCENMLYNATDVPDLTNVEDLSYMFYGASSFNADLNGWNVSNVKYMNYMFAYAAEFNSDLDQWDVGKVITMEAMFNYASKFNGNIENWKVGNVTNMSAMLSNASEFNRNISDWETGKVTTMYGMFAFTPFNQDISGWDTAKVTIMSTMFLGAVYFDQNLGDWDIGSITGMVQMFNSAGMSAQNYGSTLIGWSNQPNHPQNIILGAANVEYCQDNTAVQGARDLLVIGESWTIVGDIPVNCN
jgi:surface protein